VAASAGSATSKGTRGSVSGTKQVKETSSSTNGVSTTVPAAARTMALLEVFAREKRELTKSEVARQLGVPESSSSDLLNTLYEIGYVTRSARRKYYPTGRLLATATAIAQHDALGAFGVEATTLLAERAGETAAFAALAGAKVKIIAVAQGRHPLRYVLSAGDTYRVHATAIGKALLGGLSDEEAIEVLNLETLEVRTPNTKTDPVEILREIKKHRRLGWYQAVEEGTIGVSSIAVSGMVGDRLTALGLIGPTSRIGAKKEDLVQAVLETREVIFGADRGPRSE
jgi:DNA-binding IclR family transcriptional regulator